MDRVSSVVEVLDTEEAVQLYEHLRDAHLVFTPDFMASQWGQLTFFDLGKAYAVVEDVIERLDVPNEFTVPGLCHQFAPGVRYSLGHVLTELMVQRGEWEWVNDLYPYGRTKNGRLRRVVPRTEVKEPEEEAPFDFDAVVDQWIASR